MTSLFFKRSLSENKLRNFLIGLYILIILGLSASVKAQTTSQPYPYRGEITMTAEGTAFLVVSDREYYEIVSNDIDFEKFNGTYVEVNAEIVKLTSGPVLTVQEMAPIDADVVSQKNISVLHVLRISEITL